MAACAIDAADFVGRWEAITFLQRIEGRVEIGEAVTMVERDMPLRHHQD